MIRWEYTTSVTRPTGWQTIVGDRLGTEGCELVSVFDTNRADGDTKEVVAVFKRLCN